MLKVAALTALLASACVTPADPDEIPSLWALSEGRQASDCGGVVELKPGSLSATLEVGFEAEGGVTRWMLGLSGCQWLVYQRGSEKTWEASPGQSCVEYDNYPEPPGNDHLLELAAVVEQDVMHIWQTVVDADSCTVESELMFIPYDGS